MGSHCVEWPQISQNFECAATNDVVCRHFQKGISKRGADTLEAPNSRAFQRCPSIRDLRPLRSLYSVVKLNDLLGKHRCHLAFYCFRYFPMNVDVNKLKNLPVSKKLRLVELL